MKEFDPIKYMLLVGAFERDNFGDLLFAKIFDRIVSPMQTIKAGLIGRDLTHIGGDCVVSLPDIAEFFATAPPAGVIHCGGEIFPGNRRNSMAVDLGDTDAAVLRKMPQSVSMNLAVEMTAVARGNFAYCLNPAKLPEDGDHKTPYVFYSVGATDIEALKKSEKSLEYLQKIIKKAAFFAVRDKRSRDVLKESTGKRPALYPDLAHTLVKYCSENIKQAELSALPGLDLEPDTYFTFQVGVSHGRRMRLEKLAHALHEIIKRHEYTLVLQPAGIGPGHDSFEQLERLRDLVAAIDGRKTIIINRDRNIWSQVAVIKNSACWIGTSLHGRIVSTALCVPKVNIGNLLKIESYATTWPEDVFPYGVGAGELASSVEKALNIPAKKRRQIADTLAEKSDAGISELMKHLPVSTMKHRREAEEAVRLLVQKSLSRELDRLRHSLAASHYDAYRNSDSKQSRRR